MPGKHRCIILIGIINTLGTLTNCQKWPILLFKEADSGVIPCIPRGQTTTFFWTRGEWYNISNEIAYNVNGVSGPDTEKFHVFSNGSLLLKNMSLMDEGNYYCRITSDRTECHGSVNVQLKAANKNKLPYIDRCSPNKGCTIYENPSSTTLLTCKAKKVSSDMSLKWFNESKQITDDVEESQDKNAMNETIISSTIKIKYDEPQFLTCQASSVKMETAFAHVQLQSEPVHRTSAGIIVVTVVLGATCAVLLGFLLYTVIKQKRDKKTKPASERSDGESTLFLKETDAIKEEDLDKLKKKISAEQKRTQELENELSAERAKRSKEEKIKEELEKELSAEKAKRSVEEKIKEESKEKLQKTETELRKLERLQLKQNAINEQGKGAGKKLNETIDKYEREIKEKDKKLQNAEVELRSMSEKLQSLTSQLQTKDNEIKSLTSQLETKDQELKSTKDTLQKTRDTLEAEKRKVRKTENKLKLSEENLKEAKSEIKNLSSSHELFQRQLRSKVLEGKDNYTTFCRIKTAKIKADSFITRKDEVVLKTTGSEYKYSFIFPDTATREDMFSHFEDLVQNAIDGGKSAIVVHGNTPEHNSYVMYGSGSEADEGIVLRTIRKIFHVLNKLINMGYEAEVNASFAKILPGMESHFIFSDVDGKANDKTNNVFSNNDVELKGVRVSVPTEETAISFLKKYTKTHSNTDGKQLFTNNFVQFFITTKLKSASTGTLTFVLYNNAEALKDCFKDHNKPPLFPHYFSSMINAEGSKVRILSNIDEEKKEEAKDHLRFTNWIVKEKSSFSRFKEKLGFSS